MILHRRVLIHVEWHPGYLFLPLIRIGLEPEPVATAPQRETQLSHVVAPVEHPLPTRKRAGIGDTACGLPLDGDVLMAMSPASISCPVCAAAYVVDPNLLGPT